MSAPGAISPVLISPRVLDSGGGGWETGNVLLFDGVNDWVDLPVNIALTGDFTFSFWARGDLGIYFRDGAGNAYHVRKFDTTLLRLRVNGSNFGYSTNQSDSDTWYHIMVTRSGNDGRVYRDGVITVQGAQDIGSTTWNIKEIGSSTTLVLDSRLEDLYIWDGVVGSVANALSIFNGGTPVDPESVIADADYKYRFNSEGDSIVATDSGENENNGTLTDFPESGMWLSRL